MAAPAWDLKGRTAFITGAARGIGLETARRLVGRGMRVALVDRDEEEVAAVAAALGEERALGLGADVTDTRLSSPPWPPRSDRFGGIDVSVAGAGWPGR